ncbi:MAG: D-alanyl-D-alanine carboxypeptidase [Lachnospiraceae bacterium]|nr:D-alanyl-D-alanine carboxypeptidase [Lachnospiraceae bacterium]MBP5254874.1 D-alanyl-D-alanine carboxypeptidase [Lachnospiraceae bacterium]
MSRRLFLPVLAAVLVLGMTGCGSGSTGLKSYYEYAVLASLDGQGQEDLKLPGFAEDLCIIEDPKLYDASLFEAKAAGLFAEDDREVLYAKNAYDRVYPASLTKIMTALIVIERCRDLTERVRVGPEMREGLTDSSSLAGLVEGAYYTVEDLLYGLIIPSGNDAANVLAAHTAGSIDAFVDLMNEKAKALGMVDTHFANPHGLHESGHYTTVYDLYLLARACISYPLFVRIGGEKTASVTGYYADGTSFVQTYKSTNSYLLNYTVLPKGLTLRCTKTGYTVQAGRCLIMVARDGAGKRYIGIVAKASTYDGLYEQMNRLLEFALEEEE